MKNDKYYNDFLKEQSAMLEKRSIDDLKDFILKWSERGLYEKDFALRFCAAPDTVKLATLCKIICHVAPFGDVSKSTHNWAKETLQRLKMTEKIRL